MKFGKKESIIEIKRGLQVSLGLQTFIHQKNMTESKMFMIYSHGFIAHAFLLLGSIICNAYIFHAQGGATHCTGTCNS